MKFRAVHRNILLIVLAVHAGGAAAQGSGPAYPAKPVHIVVPSSPGGGTDILARVVAQKLSENLGQQFVVENRPGAGQVIGIESVARSAPTDVSIT